MNTAFHRPKTRTRLACVGAVTGLAAALTFGAAGPAFAIAPTATADFYPVTAGQPLSIPAAQGILANDTDPENDPVSIHSLWSNGAALPGEELVTNPDGSFTYYPPTGYTGTREWLYRAQDAADVSPVVTITFTITAANQAPIGVADVYTTPVDTQLVIPGPSLLANDSDPDGDALVLGSTGGYPVGEFIASVDGGFTFNPPAGFTGTKQYYYYVSDGNLLSAQTPITITVGNGPAVTQAPVAVGDSYATAAGTPLVVPAPGIFGNDSDADSSFVVYTTGQPSDGTLSIDYATGAFTYTPDAGFSGTDSFVYKLTDINGNHSAEATVTIEVTAAPTNAAPVAAADAYDVTAGTTLVVAAPGLLANDTDAEGDTLTPFEYVQPDVWLPGEAFAFDGTAGGFSYTPPTGYTGTRVLEYRIHDGVQPSLPATITFTIAAVPPLPTLPEAPEAASGTASTGGGEGGALASTGLDGAGLAGTAGLAGLLVAGGMLARRFSRREV